MKIRSARSIFLLLAIVSIAAVAMQLLKRPADAHVRKAPVDNKTWPAGHLLFDATTGLPAVAPLTMNFARSPGTDGPDGKGRYLLAINSGYGLLFNSKSKAQQTLSVIDLNRKPEPQVIQNIYFPAPQSANVGITFDWRVLPDGKYRFYVAGGYENKIWIFGLDPKAAVPVAPANKPDETVKADSIDVTALSTWAPSPNYNDDVAAVYPTGLGLSRDGETIFVANNLGDTLGVISDLRNSRWIDRVSLKRPGSKQFVYPYEVQVMNDADNKAAKVFVSLWGDGSVAVVTKTASMQYNVSHIPVGRHPTAMKINRAGTRLYVANSNDDTVSVIDTASEKVIETIGVKVSDTMPIGASPEGLALDEDHQTLYVADAHANAVAVVRLAANPSETERSKLIGLIPTGRYASAVAIIGSKLFIANGKGTGMENSSMRVNDSGLFPNIPNQMFPGDTYNKRGLYSASAVSGNISLVDVPDEKQLYEYTQTVLRQNGLLGVQKRSIFAGGKSPFKHVIYIIRENRTYDQVFGDLAASGDGNKADGDDWLAIFGAGSAAATVDGEPQNITPNARALALRFGLLDRFFVNAEASPDGHNWSTAAFSNDYVDKAFRWNYSRRGRTYDFEGFNRLPTYNPPSGQPPVQLPPVFDLPATGEDVAGFLKRYVPYLNGARDIAEPQTLYLWDAAARAGKTYRNYGEYVATVSEADVKELNTRKSKKYPDLSPTQTAFATKKSLEGHYSSTVRNFDMDTPDIMTTDSYKAFREKGRVDPAIAPEASDDVHRGMSRFGAWRQEFRGYVDDVKAGKGDHLPELSILRLSNDHTGGLRRNTPTPQFYVAENDLALGRVVEEVSKSPYWADTAIFVVEDDAQDGPDHVDAHRSPAFVISAYNRPGALVHEFHNTVSLIRTLELCLGLEPMNFLDTNATPIDIFTAKPDLRPYESQMPSVSLNNLFPPDRTDAAMAYFMERTAAQDLTHPDMADPRELNEIIWFSVRGKKPMPGISRMPAYDLFRTGMKEEEDADDE